MRHNIFLFGRALAGKTTVAKLLEDRDYAVFALADAIKDEIYNRIGRPPTKADRALMIDVGQTYKRLYGERIWCDYLNEDVESYRHADNNALPVVIEDGRHIVEYEFFVKERGFIPVKVVASDETRLQRMLIRDNVDQRGMIGNAENEVDTMEPTFEIDNDGTMDDLIEHVDKIVSYLDFLENMRCE